MSWALLLAIGGIFYAAYCLIGAIVAAAAYRRMQAAAPDLWPDVLFGGAFVEGVSWPLIAWRMVQGRGE